MFIFGIVMHELGHLIGGALGGYRLYYIEVFGLFLIKGDNGYKVGRSKGVPVGQCIMYHEDLNKNPVSLIIGGLAANFLLVVSGIIMFIVTDGIVIRTVSLIVSISNLSLGLMNIFGSTSSDGMTLKEVWGSKTASRVYNEIMVLYFLLGDPQNRLSVFPELEEAYNLEQMQAENESKILRKIDEQIADDLKKTDNCGSHRGSLREELEMLFDALKEQEKNGVFRKGI